MKDCADGTEFSGAQQNKHGLTGTQSRNNNGARQTFDPLVLPFNLSCFFLSCVFLLISHFPFFSVSDLTQTKAFSQVSVSFTRAGHLPISEHLVNTRLGEESCFICC